MTNRSPMSMPAGGRNTVLDLGHGFDYWPPPFIGNRNPSSIAFNGTTIQGLAVIFQAPRSGLLGDIAIPLGMVTATGVYSMNIETMVNATGHPDGVALATVNFTATATTDNSTIKQVTFATPPNLVAGAMYAATIRFVSGTANCGFTRTNQTFDGTAAGGNQRHAQFNGTTWTRSTAPLGMYMKFADERKWRQMSSGVRAMSGNPGFNLRSSDSPNEAGNRLRLPFGVRCVGLWFYMNIGAPATNITQQMRMRLYDDNDAILASQDFYGSWINTANVGGQVLMFPQPKVLAANTWYKATLTGLNAVVGTAFSMVNRASGVPTGASQDPGSVVLPDWWGRDVYQISRTNGGAWTHTTSQVSIMGIIYDQLIVPEVPGPAMFGTTPHQYY